MLVTSLPFCLEANPPWALACGCISSLLEPVRMFCGGLLGVSLDAGIQAARPGYGFPYRGLQLAVFGALDAGPQSCMPRLWIFHNWYMQLCLPDT